MDHMKKAFEERGWHAILGVNPAYCFRLDVNLTHCWEIWLNHPDKSHLRETKGTDEGGRSVLEFDVPRIKNPQDLDDLMRLAGIPITSGKDVREETRNTAGQDLDDISRVAGKEEFHKHAFVYNELYPVCQAILHHAANRSINIEKYKEDHSEAFFIEVPKVLAKYIVLKAHIDEPLFILTGKDAERWEAMREGQRRPPESNWAPLPEITEIQKRLDKLEVLITPSHRFKMKPFESKFDPPLPKHANWDAKYPRLLVFKSRAWQYFPIGMDLPLDDDNSFHQVINLEHMFPWIPRSQWGITSDGGTIKVPGEFGK